MDKEEMEQKLITEQEHSAFLEKILKTLHGPGWNTLTLADAKNLKVVASQPAVEEDEPGLCCLEYADETEFKFCPECGGNIRTA